MFVCSAYKQSKVEATSGTPGLPAKPTKKTKKKQENKSQGSDEVQGLKKEPCRLSIGSATVRSQGVGVSLGGTIERG